jgi:deoxyadenosine/deoxycytidine kinase
MKFVFSIEGNIGSGKSTLLDLLKKSNTSFIYLQEPVNTWNEIKDSSGVSILEKYYADSERYAFPFQMMAYITRLSLIRKAIKEAPQNSVIITERSIYTDREIFAKMLYDSGKIEDVCYSIYLRWFDEFLEFNLHGIIYVKTTPETCMERVNLRNRKGESIPLSYLSNCHSYHENWLTNKRNVLVIDGETAQSQEKVLKIIEFIFFSLKKN